MHRHFLAEILAPFGIGLFAFSLVLLIHRLFRLADLVVAKGVPATLVGRLLLALYPTFLEYVLPAAVVLAVLMALGRMGQDAETTALAAAGIGMRGLLLPILLLSGAAFLASLFLGWSGISWGHRTLAETLSRIVVLRAGAGASERSFQSISPDTLLYPDRVSADGSRMEGVMLSQRISGQEPLLVLAREGTFVPGGADRQPALILRDGTIHQRDRGGAAYRIASFRTMDFRMPPPETAVSDRGTPKTLSLPALYEGMRDSRDPRRAADCRYLFHRRLSLAVSCLAFGLIALPLGMLQRSRGKSPALALTLSIIVVYYLFLAAGKSASGAAPGIAVVLFWLPNAAGIAGATILLRFSELRILALPDPRALLRRAR